MATGSFVNATVTTEDTALASAPAPFLVSVAEGGTGATTAAAARTNLGLGDAATYSLLPITKGGTGAQTSEDAASNLGFAEGAGYIKFPNGTMICWGEANTGAIAANGGTATVEVQFPYTFVSSPTVTCTTRYAATSAARYFGSSVHTIYTTGARFCAVNTYTTAVTDGSHFINWVAIGRWKA